MQMPGRTPANAAMTAMTFNQLSGGSLIDGLSGRRSSRAGTASVMPNHWPARANTEIVRRIFRREAPLTLRVSTIRFPYHGEDATGLGKPLKSTLVVRREYSHLFGGHRPQNVELAAGSPMAGCPSSSRRSAMRPSSVPTLRPAPGQSRQVDGQLRHRPTVSVVINDNPDIAYIVLRPMLALYIGGMWAREQNFYNDLAGRYGFETRPRFRILSPASKGAAMARVPGRAYRRRGLVRPRDRDARTVSHLARQSGDDNHDGVRQRDAAHR